MVALSTITIFLSAALLFAVQPMFGRMALPLLGGSPGVWNTALVFYQGTLLAAYAYAYGSTRVLGIRTQAAIQLGLLLAPFLVLPIEIPAGRVPPTEGNPIPWLLALLATAVGLPFFVVSTTAPLVQRWFAATGHSSAGDPYFLYAASNAGSLLALLSYPLLIEPTLPLAVQARLWSLAYAVLVLFVAGCALTVLVKATGLPTAPGNPAGGETRLGWKRRARWVVLAFVPSSLMLGVTAHVTTDVAAVPLLWVVPLAVYLSTFVAAFARRSLVPSAVFVRLLPLTILPLVMTMAARVDRPIVIVIGFHLAVLFVGSMVCHGELARDRPPPEHLTEFYLWMAAGGAAGGVFNALVAPLIFSSVVEYPLMLVAVCLLAPLHKIAPAEPPRGSSPRLRRQLDRVLAVVLPAAPGVLMLALVASPERAAYLAMFGLPTFLALAFSRHPLKFGLAVAALLAAGLWIGQERQVLHAERSFFGVNRVAFDPSGAYRQLIHGTTLHGRQAVDPDRARAPIGYYAASGPLGQVFASLRRPATVAVAGLGAGGIAGYAVPGERWTFYEIDPAVERIARDPRWFTFLRDAPSQMRVVLGDARLSLASARDVYDLLIVDVYSSDAVPVHLLTREALRVYLGRLASHGLLVFNTSNRHFDLAPVVGALARDAGLSCKVRRDTPVPEDVRRGALASEWVVAARDSADVRTLTADARWQDPAPHPRVWTDDHSSILSVLRSAVH